MELEHIAVRSGRLSSFLKGELNMSTGLMNRLKWTGALLVNGQPARTNTQVTPGDRITALLDDPEPEYPAEDMPLEIRYEDRDLLVVDKPPGMLIHPSRHRMTGTLANGVLGYYRRTGQACAFHPATRLDRDTFGLVLLAKNAHIHRLLNDIHTRGQLHKIYHGLVYGAPPEPEGTIDMPIGRCPKPSLLRRIDPLCQPARTRYRLLEQGPAWSLLELEPLTGRTHQLRVHCAFLGCPMLGDPQYGTTASQALSPRLGLSYQQLCARELHFPHPMTGVEVSIQSGLGVKLADVPPNLNAAYEKAVCSLL